jgi:hypothetical protein
MKTLIERTTFPPHWSKKRIARYKRRFQKRIVRKNNQMKKIKQLLTVDQRVSMFQTAMNNAGRNFEGKKVKSERIAVFAADLYRAALKDIHTVGNVGVEELKAIAAKPRKVVKRANLNKLMASAKKNGNSRKKQKKAKRPSRR